MSIVHTENSHGWGGQEIRILTEARGMLERGHHATLIAPREAPIADAALRMGIPYVALPLRRKRLRELLSLRRWLIDHRANVDVLNTHSSTDSWLSAVACTTLRRPPPVVRTRHVSTSVRNRVTTRWLYQKAAAHIVTAGEALKHQLVIENGVAPERITSVPTGIDLERFVPGDAASARQRVSLRPRLTLGIVATLRDWKGHAYLFEAIASDREGWRDWNVIVVGDGPQRAALEALHQRLGLADTIRFTGQQEDVVPWLQACDLFTLPSYGEEGVPQSIMQAMACGLPVVSTPIGAITEAVEDGVTGLLVEPRSAQSLAAGLARLRDDEGLRRDYGAAAHRRAQRDFGLGLMLDRMEAVFAGVIGRD